MPGAADPRTTEPDRTGLAVYHRGMVHRSVFLLLSACTLPNPAYDAPTAGPDTAPATGDLSSGTSSPTSSALATSDQLTVDDTSDVATTTTTSASTTTDPTASASDTSSDPSMDSTSSASGAVCPPCGECETCVNAACVPATPDAPCQSPTGTPCELQVHGPGPDGPSKSCHAYAPGTGVCDGLGACVWSCLEMGAAFITCDTACLRPDFACPPGALVQDVPIASLCFVDQMTAGCKGSCNNNNGFYDYDHNRCDGAGKCVYDSNEDCALYKCSDAGCYTSCQGPAQCSPAAFCNANQQCQFDPP